MIPINIPEQFNKVVVDYSIGVDSSLLLYSLCEYATSNNKQYDILIRHTVDLVRAPKTADRFNELFEMFKLQYPSLNLTKRILSFVENKPTVTKTLFLERDKVILVKQGWQVFMAGNTANPPLEEQARFDFGGGAQQNRDVNHPNHYTEVSDFGSWMNYRPMTNINKKEVAQYYHQPFLKTLFPLTVSCVCSNPFDTAAWTKPCKKCWWCKEKHWAFGKYDGESLE